MATIEIDGDPLPDARDELEVLSAQLRELESERQVLIKEKQEWTDERKSLLAKIHYLTQILTGHVSEKRTNTEQRLLHTPVDAGVTAAEAESKRDQREKREEERRLRKKTKNDKKGRGTNGKKKDTNGGGRRPVNPNLKITTEIIVVPAADRFFHDGTPLILLGYEDSEKEYYVPAGIMRLIRRREIWGLPDTREEVIRAPNPPAIVPRSKYHDSMIIEMMIRKYMRGMPFYRVLHDIRAMGSDLTDSTLSDLTQRFAEFMKPITQAIRTQVLSATVAHVDETPLPTQDGGRYLWAVLGGQQVYFHVGGRGGDELRTILGLPLKETKPTGRTWEEARRLAAAAGIHWKIVNMMADGYAVYDTVLNEAGIGRLNCWAHGRRGFIPYQKEPMVSEILDSIGVLYAIEKQAKKMVEHRELSDEEAISAYTDLRIQRTKPQLLIIHALLVAHREHFVQGSEQRTTIDFLLNNWDSFIAFADNGALPIDNNDCERALRMIVVARKSWMLIGSEDAAPFAADIFTVMESCRLCRVEPRAYVSYVVERLHAQDTTMDMLTPKALAARFPLRE